MNLNIFQWPYTKYYYLTHPWKWFSQLWGNIKGAYRRIRYGWSYCDVWNWDSWFCSVVPPMLRHMADYGGAYPGGEPFETPEKWHDWLYKMANTIERLQYDNWLEDQNEYSEDYNKTFEDENEEYGSSTKEEIREQYYKRCEEIHKTREQFLKEVFCQLAQGFDALWD